MNKRRFFIWLIKGILIIIAVFLLLMIVDWILMPIWLNNKSAIAILAVTFFFHCFFGVLSAKSRRKRHKRVENRPAQTDYADPIERREQRVNDIQRNRRVKTKRKRRSGLRFASIAIFAIALVIIGANHINHLNQNDIPSEIAEFAKRYPEAKEYANNYSKYADKDFDMDVSKEMEESSIPLFIQWDKRWGYKHYGEGTSWSLMTEGAEHYGLNASKGDVSSDFILDNLSSKTPMICSMTPGDFTMAGHFIVLKGIDKKGRIIVNDPNSPKNSKKHWDVDVLTDQMKSIWIYSL